MKMNDDGLWESSGFVEQGADVRPDQVRPSISSFYMSLGGYCRLFSYPLYGRLHLLKTLKSGYVGVSLYEEMLQKEFAIGYRLDHPNIRRTIDWKNVDGVGSGIVLEYVDGVTLRELMDSGRLTCELAYKLVGEICSALQYMHSKQVVHRDLKPENILVTHNGYNAKIIDFSLSDCDDSYLLKVPAGTRRYMAPELLQPDMSWDLRCDIYSLGVMLEEMGALLHDRRLKRVAAVCMQTDREKRYSGAPAVMSALRAEGGWRRMALRWGVAVVALGAIGAGWRLSVPLGASPKGVDFAMPAARGNTVVNPLCRQILFEESGRVQASGTYDAQDSLRLVARLRQALDKVYPLPEQKKSAAYLQEWEAISKEVGRMLQRYRSL